MRDGRWRMHAHDDNGVYTNIGPRPWVELHGLPLPIVQVDVRLVRDDDPAATHWGWLKTGEDEPSLIWPSHAQFSVCFPYGPRAEEQAGRGRTVRLAVTRVPQRIQRRRTKGWRLPEGAVYVGRPTKWGNPWRIIPVRDNHYPWGEAADVIHETTGSSIGRFERTTRIPHTGAPYWAVHAYRRDLTPELIAGACAELAGRDLACWCPLDQPCHADVLLEVSNPPPS